MQYNTEGCYVKKVNINYEINAVCVLVSDRIRGVVYMKEYDGRTTFAGKVSGLTPNQKHALHIHEAGDLTDGCASACAHYNPHNTNHGGRESNERHVGDLGNLEGDENGYCEFSFTDRLVKIYGYTSVIGRSVIVHEDEDDLGLGGHSDSLTTGHAGKRVVCGVIGYRKGCR
jgi:Cu-Zn family superoxide dismutase